MESYVPLQKHVHEVDYPPAILSMCFGMCSKIMEGKKCNFRASVSSDSMIVVYLSYSTNNLVAKFVSLAETLSTVIGTGSLMILALSQKVLVLLLL